MFLSSWDFLKTDRFYCIHGQRRKCIHKLFFRIEINGIEKKRYVCRDLYLNTSRNSVLNKINLFFPKEGFRTF